MNTDAQAAWQLARIKETVEAAERHEGPELVLLAALRCGSQSAVRRLSGVDAATLAELNSGRKPRKRIRAAIIYAMIKAQL